MVVRGICMSERMPSCMRAPPEAANRMNGARFVDRAQHAGDDGLAGGHAERAAMKRKSCAAATTSWPSSGPSPTSTASSSSVSALAVFRRSL